MTKSEALYNFFSSFGMDAYPSSAVPAAKEVKFPYLIYDAAIGNEGDSIAIMVQIWFKTTSEAKPNAKVDEIAKRIGLGGTIIAHDNGGIWIKRGTPWCNSLADEKDASLKRRILNIELDFM